MFCFSRLLQLSCPTCPYQFLSFTDLFKGQRRCRRDNNAPQLALHKILKLCLPAQHRFMRRQHPSWQHVAHTETDRVSRCDRRLHSPVVMPGRQPNIHGPIPGQQGELCKQNACQSLSNEPNNCGSLKQK